MLQRLAPTDAAVNTYGQTLKRSEHEGLQAFLRELSSASGPLSLPPEQAGNAAALREAVLNFLREASDTRKSSLVLVEGAMALLEQLFLTEARVAVPTGGPLVCAMSPAEMLSRWQLVIGADVGGIQYIPVVEELQVAPGGATFALDTDLDFLFTGFSGDSAWLSPGHLRYHVQRVRLELRPPKAWMRAQAWAVWRSTDEGKVAGAQPPAQVLDPGGNRCRPDLSRPALTLPLPFPENELFIFCSNGDTAVLRSKLGGLITLRNRT